jgi:hypothetical protein
MSEKFPFNNGNDNDDLRELWQGQNLERERMSLPEIRKKAEEFERTIRHRNLREYIGAAIVVIAFGALIFRSSNAWGRLGAGLVVLGAFYVAYVLHIHGSAEPVPEDEARLTLIHFHRSSLERQRDLLRNIWRWYLLPFVPGLGLLTVSAAVRDGVLLNPNRTPEQVQHGFVLLRVTALPVGFFFVVAALNKRAARRLQLKIDALDAEEADIQ